MPVGGCLDDDVWFGMNGSRGVWTAGWRVEG